MSNRTLKRIVSLPQIAELFGVTERWINRLAKEKDFPKVARGKYDLLACVRWYIAYLTRQIDDARRGGGSMQHSEERKSAAQAAMLELRLAKARELVVDIADVTEITASVLHSVRSILLGIPKHAARELGNPSIEAYLDDFVRRCLDEIASLGDRIDRLGGGGGPGLVPQNHQRGALESPGPAQADGKPVVGPVPVPVPGAQRRKRPVANKRGRVST